MRGLNRILARPFSALSSGAETVAGFYLRREQDETMPRIRTIKPEFWTNEKLSVVSESAHMLAAALLNHSDDEGYFNAHAGLLKAAIYPLRKPGRSVERMLEELDSVGYIELLEGDDGRTYGRIVAFLTHQKISHPTESRIAPKIKGLQTSLETSGKIPSPLDSSALKGKERNKGKEGNGTGNREALRAAFVEGYGSEPGPWEPSCDKCIKAHKGKDSEVTPEAVRLVAANFASWTDGTSLLSNLLRERKWAAHLARARKWKPTQTAGPKCRKPVKTGVTVDFGSGPVDEESACALQSEHAGDCNHERRDDE